MRRGEQSWEPDRQSGRPLAGRDPELQVWSAVLRNPDSPLRVVVVTGDPGLGKTAFLNQCRDLASQADAAVVMAHGVDGDHGTPFATLTRALDPYVAAHRVDLQAFLQQFSQELNEVLPSSTKRLVFAPSNLPRQHAALRQLLEAITPRGGLVLLVDDLQWADGATISFLADLCRQGVSRGLTLGLAFRPRQVSGHLASAVDTLVGAGNGIRLPLSPLSISEAFRLIGDSVDEPEVRRHHAVSGGIPRYLVALASRAAQRMSPECGSEVLGAELDALDPSERLVAQAAAVLGIDFDPALLPAVTLLRPEAVATAIDELARRDLIRPGAIPARLTFRHPLVREAIYATAGNGWRRLAHLRALDVLRSARVAAELWAHHLEHSAAIGDRSAITGLLRAAGSSRWTAPAAAAHWYRTAHSLLPATAAVRPQLAWLLISGAEAAIDAGELSPEAFLKALAVLPKRLSVLRSRAAVGASKVLSYRGRYDEAATILDRELDLTLHSPGRRVEAVLQERATARVLVGDFAGAQSDATAIIDAVSNGRHQVQQEMAARAIAGLALAIDGELDAAASHAEVAGRIMDLMSDAELLAHLRTVAWTTWTDAMSGPPAAASGRQERAIALARHAGHVTSLAHLLAVRGISLRRLGRLGDARRCLHEALELALEVGATQVAALALATMTEVAALLGEVIDETRLGGISVQHPSVQHPSGRRTWIATRATTALGHARLESGDPVGCQETVTTGGGGADLPLVDPYSRASAYELLTRAALAQGNHDLARQWVDRAAKSAQHVGGTAAAFAALAECRLLLALGNYAAAAEQGVLATDQFASSSAPLDAGIAQLAVAKAFGLDGQRARAVSEVRAAHGTFIRCGAARLEEESTRELRRLGVKMPRVPSRGPARLGPATLSDREREVAEFVANGMTNREIAAAMFLSEKTVERHLSSIFTKVGVRSRVRLVLLLKDAQHES